MSETYQSPVLDENTLQLYRDYVGITDPEKLKLHLMNVQSRLLKNEKIHYRCIEQYKFAFSRIYHRFFYKKIIEMAQQLEKPYFLDIGCCTGTDLRKLLLDGYPKDYLIGMDIEQNYIDCGYLLFKDNPSTCPIQFIVNEENAIWEPTEKMTIVHAGSVFHLFPNQEAIRQFVKVIAGMLKQGGVLVGGHVCADKPMEFFRQSTQKLKYYMGLDEFKQSLISEGFTNIEIETSPRLGDEEDFTAFWISFYAIYNP